MLFSMPRRAKIHPTDPVARRLFFSRAALGFDDQGAFAEAAGMEPQTYNPFERAKRPLTKQAAQLLQVKHGLPIEWLFDGVPDRLPHGLVLKLIALGALPPLGQTDAISERIIRKPRK